MERWLWGAVAALALIVAGLVAFRYFHTEPELPQVRAPISSCDVQQGACTVAIDGIGTVSLSIAPRPIPLVAPLTIEVESTVPGVHSAEIDFSGVDMNMGINRFPLVGAAAGHFGGQGMLPVCVRSRMSWEAKVMLKTDQVVYVAPFRFETVRSK